MQTISEFFRGNFIFYYLSIRFLYIFGYKLLYMKLSSLRDITQYFYQEDDYATDPDRKLRVHLPDSMYQALILDINEQMEKIGITFSAPDPEDLLHESGMTLTVGYPRLDGSMSDMCYGTVQLVKHPDSIIVERV